MRGTVTPLVAVLLVANDVLAVTGDWASAEELDRDVSTVSHHLGRLAEDGLVERESVSSKLAPEVEDALGADGSGPEARQP